MYRWLISFLIVGVFTAGMVYGTDVEGYCFLAGRADHSGTEVKCIKHQGGTFYTSTADTGYWGRYLPGGDFYDFVFSHSGFYPDTLPDILVPQDDTLRSPMQLDTVVLYPVDSTLSGPLSGTLGPGDYYVLSYILVQLGDELTILPGTRLLFTGHYQFNIYGRLNAIGTEQDSIAFTRFLPTDYFRTRESNWSGLHFILANDSCRLEYCLIEHTTMDVMGPGFSSGGGEMFYVRSNSAGHDHGIDGVPHLARNGGGVECSNCSPSFAHCTIIENRATYGGGVYCYISSSKFTDCTISDNSATSNYGGGGVRCDASSPAFMKCTFSDNEADHYGGGIYCDNSSPTFKYCDLNNNTAIGGYTTCGEGGGVYSDGCSSLDFIHCTISDNSADYGGGVYSYFSSLTLNSTIIAFSASGEGVYFSNSPDAVVEYCDVYGNGGGDFGGDVPPGLGVLDTVNYNGDSCDCYLNIFCDPLFTDPEIGDYHLTWYNYPDPDDTKSCCIDAGDSRVNVVQVTEDTTGLWENGTGEPGDSGHGKTPKDGMSPTRPPDDIPRWLHDPDGTRPDIGAFYFDQSEYGTRTCDVGTSESGDAIPIDYFLSQNYPNPFNPMTTIRYGLPQAGEVRIAVYNILGQQVATLANDFQAAGSYSVIWNATNVPSGTYFVQMRTGTDIRAIKMLLLK